MLLLLLLYRVFQHTVPNNITLLRIFQEPCFYGYIGPALMQSQPLEMNVIALSSTLYLVYPLAPSLHLP